MGFSFPVAYFLYKTVCGFTFFPFLNFLGVFVVMGIGVDDLFVVVDKWHQAVVHLPPDAPVADIAAAVGPDAALAMLLTSITTAAAFFATCLVPVAPIRCRPGLGLGLGLGTRGNWGPGPVPGPGPGLGLGLGLLEDAQ